MCVCVCVHSPLTQLHVVFSRQGSQKYYVQMCGVCVCVWGGGNRAHSCTLRSASRGRRKTTSPRPRICCLVPRICCLCPVYAGVWAVWWGESCVQGKGEIGELFRSFIPHPLLPQGSHQITHTHIEEETKTVWQLLGDTRAHTHTHTHTHAAPHREGGQDRVAAAG